MASIEAKIQDAAARNKQFLQTLKETDHAVPALTEHKRLISELESQLSQSTKRVESLDQKRKQTLGQHEKYRDSHVRRFVFKASGQKEKFSQRAEEGEREYFETLQQAHQENELNKNITSQLNEARTAEHDLQAVADRHQRTQAELDALYNDIFGGPTPQFPDEDAKEQRSAAATTAYGETKGKHEAERAVVAMLKDASGIMRRALSEIERALSYSRYDMFGGGSMADMMERSHLSNADQLINQTRVLAARAQKASPYVMDLPQVKINHGNLMSDVFFDNIFTDMAFHEEIKRSQAQAMRFYNALVEQGNEGVRRRDELAKTLKTQEKELDEAREELQKAREKAFEQVLRGEGPQGVDVAAARGVDDVPPPPGPPPAYNAAGGESQQTGENAGASDGKKEKE